MKVLNGNCIDRMKEMGSNSIDAIVSDPPYGLKFMGKGWDDMGEGSSQRKWHEEWLKEAFRVLKSGGVIKAFSGTRTFHHLMGAMESVGFSDLRLEAWNYGCLSEDTEILTSEGWVEHSKLNNGSMVVSYCMDNDTYQVEAIEEVVRYEYKDTAYRIQSNHTDQIVSRNHRCIVEREGKRTFLFAEHLQEKEVVPYLVQLPTMSETFYIQEQNSKALFKGVSVASDIDDEVQGVSNGISDQEPQSRLLQQGVLPKEHEGSKSTVELCCLSETLRETSCVGQKKQGSSLLSSMQRSSERRGMESPRTQGSSKLDSRERASLSGAYDGKHQSSMERWGNLSQPQGELQDSEDRLCEMSDRLPLNGEEGRICDGTSFEGGARNWQTSDEKGVCSSYQSQCRRQSVGKLDVVQEQSGSQTVRSPRKTRTTLATITPIDYEGIVWCVKVPTGAFVARRKGKIFVTGNSGFPKSLNISKAIDKAAGAEREVVGANPNLKGRTRPIGNAVGFPLGHVANITKPATANANTWQGYGTALKPAWEPICIGRKP